MFDKQFDNFLNDKITDFSEIDKNVGKKDITKGKNLDNLTGIAIGIASSDQVRSLSYGKVLISETINYRTQRPERGGLFCEQIFGPRKNYECACGKYKRIRFKGVVCERCGVEVTKSSVRRERMGHIDLHTPVAHIWFLKSVPSRIGLLLGLPVKKLEQVVYFASYIVTEVYPEKVEEAQSDMENRFKVSKVEMQKRVQLELNELKIKKEEKKITQKSFKEKEAFLMGQLDKLTEEFDGLKSKLKDLEVGEVIGELDYRTLHEKFPHVFDAGTGAEHIKTLLKKIDLEQFIIIHRDELKTASAIKQKKILQKIKLASNLLKSGQRPEWFVLDALPIIPPDLRPMIQLDGGRFASSDLNDLYRRVINRNNRLKKLMELGAPEVILKNEKRMLQEAVDMLISGDVRTNRSGYVTASKRKLKSLTDILRGKQGRFRQNLLGKRVDYSGRSVIVVGPNLKMDECGLPKTMALVLFKPFVIGKLIEKGYVYNVKHADKYIEEGGKDVWDALDEVIKGKYVLLNRAPTLHRLSIQAFRPVLIEGKAIQLHPLTCTAFNADFDGDQMAVHLPITELAQKEARELMVTSKNLLSPSSGEPIVAPSQDMVLGSYYLTSLRGDKDKVEYVFGNRYDADCSYDAGAITLRIPIKIRLNGELVTTTYGRLIFNEIVPPELGYINQTVGKGALKKILADCFELCGTETTALFADKIKDMGYKYATISGLSISKDDMIIPSSKQGFIDEAAEKVKYVQKKYWNGFLTEKEKYNQSIDVWAHVKKLIEVEMKEVFKEENHIYNLVDSGARGNWGQITQLCGMKGLVASPTGKTIELPIKSNLKEGFSTLEYFIATHGGRKGKSDTALKTAQSGYLTRRLVDSAQSIIIKEDDCHTVHYKEILRSEATMGLGDGFSDKIFSRSITENIIDTEGNLLIPAGEILDVKKVQLIEKHNIESVKIRSILTCETEGGVCKKCYGLDLGLYTETEIGTPVGIIAAQSIGEPGTQLTMRTFHSGGVAKEGGDITQGLARVEELFEARNPKYLADISDLTGKVDIEYKQKIAFITVKSDDLMDEEYYFSEDYAVQVKVGDDIDVKHVLAKKPKSKVKVAAKFPGVVKKIENNRIIIRDKVPRVAEYKFSISKNLIVKKGDHVNKGEPLTMGHINLKQLMDVAGVLSTQKYIVEDIKSIYSSQGQTVNSKHIEIMVRQMFSRVRILDKGNSNFFPGDIVDIILFKKSNDSLIKEGRNPAIGERLLLGLTKISLYTESWLSAASFQETVRVLVEASVSKKIDKLEELKENVIIGRLVPAGKQYRKLVGQEIEEDKEEFSHEYEYERELDSSH